MLCYNGVHINAHGGVLHQDGEYYWFGEHKIEGKKDNLAPALFSGPGTVAAIGCGKLYSNKTNHS